MHGEYEVWIAVYRVIKSGVIAANGLGAKILEEAEALDANTLSIFALIDSAYEAAAAEKRLANMESQ